MVAVLRQGAGMRQMPGMEPLVLTEDLLADAVAQLCVRETRFVAVVERHGVPSLRQGKPGLEGLLHLVTEQFLSLQAADAIWQRLRRRLTSMAAPSILEVEATELVSLGLSRTKARSFHHIADAVGNGALPLESFPHSPDDDVRAHLLKLHGVGPWTAENYLLSVLLRPDAWPTGDVALQASAQDLFGLDERPQGKAMAQLGERFRPWRAVAARLLWSHYRGLKAMAPA
jgi:DNA-3-methyladenine glycosylase II